MTSPDGPDIGPKDTGAAGYGRYGPWPLACARQAILVALVGVAITIIVWFWTPLLGELPVGSLISGGLPEDRRHILEDVALAAGLLISGGLLAYLGITSAQERRRKQIAAERTLRDSLRRMQAQFDAIGLVGQARTLIAGDLEALAREITETAARTVGCERVNIWQFDESETELRCVDLFEATPGRHSSGMVLREHEFRNEFDALKTLRYIDSNDPLTDPRTAGYVETYVKPLRISSMLDTAIRVSGRNLGVICLEHVDRPHRWEQDEIAFAGQLADKFAFGLMNSLRIQAEQKLRASETSLARAQAITHVGSWELDFGTRLLTWSDETYRIFGVDRNSFVPSYDAFLARVHPDDRAVLESGYLDSVAKHTDYAIDHRIVMNDGRIKVVHERCRTFYADGCPIRSIGTVQDVTERKAAEDGLIYRDRMFRAVTIGTGHLVADESLDRGMPEALRIVGETIDVDRVLVIEHVAPHGSASLRYCWQAPDIAVPLEPGDFTKGTIDPAAAAEWLAPLASGRSVATHARDVDGALRQLLDRLQNKSVLVMPIFVGGKLWGSIGIDACKAEREWTSVETDTLAIFAWVIGGIIQRNAARLSLQRSEERFRAVSEAARDAIIMIDAHGKVAYWNRAGERILGYSAEEALGKTLLSWLARGPLREAAARGMADLSDSGAGVTLGKTLELAMARKDGVEIPIELSVAPMDLAGERYAVGIMRDISERKQAEQKMVHMARFDELTGLVNRHVFVEATQQAIARAQRSAERFAVLYLDLDHFKDVNDTLGHPVGDKLLQRVAEKLTRCVRQADTVARFGGDEFAVLATGIGEPTDLAVIADKLLDAIGEPLVIQGNAIRTRASIGIATYGPDSPDSESLLSHADIALYRAKSEGRGVFRFFTENMDVEVRERVRLAADLRDAIANDALALVYQPQIDIESGRLVGLEALVRWHHRQLGPIPPGDFVTVAEKSGLISALGRWVLQRACDQLRQWQEQGISVPGVSVNLSALQFKAPVELERDIDAILSASAIAPQLLEIELTETALMETSREHEDVLRRFRDKGLRLAIDDFGTGYSSLDYLRRLPVNRIKIAQSFIVNMTTSPGDAMIVKAAISIAREFGLTIVAEGVETAEQLALLESWGCQEVQGYYYARPMTADAITQFLRQEAICPGARASGKAHPLRLLTEAPAL